MITKSGRNNLKILSTNTLIALKNTIAKMLSVTKLKKATIHKLEQF